MFYELHHHTLFSLNDGTGTGAEARSFCEKTGVKALALTDHGHCMAHEPYRVAFEGSDVKLIYGVEAYVPSVINHNLSEDDSDDTGDSKFEHLVLLAKDEIGLNALYRMVTAGYDNLYKETKPIISFDVLNEYCAPGSIGHGHIIAMSACMQGVISVEALYNEFLERDAQKKMRRADRIDIDMELYEKLNRKVDDLTAELEMAKEHRQTLNALKNKKYTARQRAVEKLRGTATYESELALLTAEMQETEQASKEFPVAKEAESAISKELTATKAELKKLEGKVSRYQATLNEADEIRARKIGEDELYANAVTVAQYYNDLFGQDNFYAELQYHGISEEAICFPMVANVAEELGIPMVATNDSHILENTPKHRRMRQILRSLRFNKWEEEMVGDSELYMKTDDEVRVALLQILPPYIVDQAIVNTAVIADKCNVVFDTTEHYPRFQTGDNRSSLQVMKDLCHKRFKELEKDGTIPQDQRKTYINRVVYELDVINKLGVVDYLLIVQDFLEYGRLLGKIDLNDPRFLADPFNIELIKKLGKNNVGMSIGIGRGSAVGSLVCYLLGITDADPIKYNLLFERFLNTERVSMPKQYWAFNVNFIAQRCAC